jgi:putative transposase
MKTRNHYSAEYKTNVVLEVLREEATVNEIAAKYGISPVMISCWRQKFLERAPLKLLLESPILQTHLFKQFYVKYSW